jgi:hypothetical protein
MDYQGIVLQFLAEAKEFSLQNVQPGSRAHPWPFTEWLLGAHSLGLNQPRYALQCAQEQLYFFSLLIMCLLNSIHNDSPFNLLCVFNCDALNITYSNKVHTRIHYK